MNPHEDGFPATARRPFGCMGEDRLDTRTAPPDRDDGTVGVVDEDPEVVKEVPAEVIGKTIPKQKALANTGGIPLLLGAGFRLACAAAISVRVLRSLAPAPLPHARVHKG